MTKFIIWAATIAGAWAQTAGTITQTTVSTVQATAGTVSCTFSSQVPALPTGVSVTCQSGTAKLTQTAVIPKGDTSGVVGSFVSGGDSVTWALTQPTGTVNWQIAANGIIQQGAF